MLKIINFVFVILFIFFGIYLYKRSKPYFPYILLFYISQLWSVLSTAYIETGIYINEQGIYSYPTGATIRLVLYNVIFFATFLFIVNRFPFNRNKKYCINNGSYGSATYIIYLIVLVLILGSIILLTYNMVISGIPLMSEGKITRFNFWNIYAVYPELQRLFGYIYFFAFMLGYIYVVGLKDNLHKELKRYSFISFIFLLTYLILQGNKFTALYISVYAFVLPIMVYLLDKNKNIINSKMILLLICCLILFLILSYNEYKININEPFKFIIYRVFGLQGHVWWGTDRIIHISNINYYAHFVDEIKEVLNPTEMHLNTGMRFLMITLGGSIGYTYINAGVNYTGAYPAIALYTFGPLGAGIVQAIFAIAVGLLVLYLDDKLHKGHFVRAVITFILLWGCYYLFTMGQFSAVINAKNILYIYILFLAEIMTGYRKNSEVVSKDTNFKF